MKKNARGIQPCFDVIKHWVHFRFGRFGDELLFGTQHVLNVHFGSRPKWTCKVQTQGLCFCPTQIYDFPTLVWGSACIADQLDILRCVYSRFLATARGDAEKHGACMKKETCVCRSTYISYAVVAGLCQGMVCADCSCCLLPRLWRDKQTFVAYCHVCGGTSNCFVFRVCGQVSAGRSMRTHKFFCFDPRLWDGKLSTGRALPGL